MLNLQTWLSIVHKVGSKMDGHPVSVDTNFGAHEEAMQKYLKEGEKSAHSLGNRGRIRFNADGTLCSEILEAYSEYGFYIFEGVLDAQELADIEKDFLDIIASGNTHPINWEALRNPTNYLGAANAFIDAVLEEVKK